MRRSRPQASAVLGIVLTSALLFGGCTKREAIKAEVPTEAAATRDIVLSVAATGTVEPINLVEVKSKASGQIVKMPVEIGSVVRSGDLLVQIDTRDVQNSFDQAQAASAAAEARAQISAAQRKRADELFAGRVVTAVEHDSSVLDDANAQAALVKARTDLDIAKQKLEDATVRAPIGGTILDKPVSVGQVISSATSSVSGGTTLLQMADLSRVRMRTLVAESDIGRVHPGEEASIVVDAYSDRPFRGTVEKIEPQAVVQQSVTMFPVLVSIDNEDGLLMPGMNGEVTVQVDAHLGVIAVPVDAVRSGKDLATVAQLLGMNADSLRSEMRGRRDHADASSATSQSQGEDPRRNRDGIDGSRGNGQWQGGRRGARGGAGGGFMKSAQAAGTGSGGVESNAGASTAGSPAESGLAANPNRFQFVVIREGNGYAIRRVKTGLSDYDYTEIQSGLDAGQPVVLLSAVELQQQRTEMQSRIRQRVGGVPGMTGSSNTKSGGR